MVDGGGRNGDGGFFWNFLVFLVFILFINGLNYGCTILPVLRTCN